MNSGSSSVFFFFKDCVGTILDKNKDEVLRICAVKMV